ncbi:MAG: thiamine diphosphokinase [Clostridia bacterium]|nr:thiamine diphosphokinase [Clostridia bacterium]
MKKALIIAAGNTEEISIKENYDLIIAADGGYDRAIAMGLTPDIFIGDMDSVRAPVADIEKIKLCVEKDFTDTEAAIEKAVEMGSGNITVIGGIGSRFDHSMANACLLKKYVDRDVEIILKDSHNEMFAFRHSCEIKGHKGDTVSFLPLDSVVSKVTLEGFYYPLVNEDVQIGETLTVSNIITEDAARVTAEKGVLLAIIARD